MWRFITALQFGGALAVVCLAAVQARAQGTMYRAASSEASADLYSGTQAGCGCEQGAACGCEESCGCLGDCLCVPGCSCGWYGGVEVVWMKPHWNTMTAIEVENQVNNGLFVSNHRGYNYDYDPTARIFLGYTGCNGLGMRASWWEYDHSSAVESATAPPNGYINTAFLSAIMGETITTQQDLQLQTFDAEFTNCFQACGGDMILGFGLRYAKVDLDVHEARSDTSRVETLDHSESFEGVGPTLALEYFRPLCCSGWSFQGSLRGSVVFGQLHERDRYVDPSSEAQYTFDTDKAQAIADLKIALQYCRSGWFTRAGWEAQYWDNVVHTDNDDFDAARASLGLNGFFVTLGKQY